MALPTFQFQATLAATRASLEIVHALLQHVLVYTGYSADDAAGIAQDIEHAVGAGLNDEHGHRSMTIRFDKTEATLRIDIAADHLASEAPPAGRMDSVTVHREGRTIVYRYERRVPAA
jgi:hypothetical protein